MDIHTFNVNGEFFLLDVNSGSVHVLDSVANRIMQLFDGNNDAAVLASLKGEYPETELQESLSELHELVDAGLLFSPSAEIPPVFAVEPIVKSLCLHIAHDCNLRCGYCFAATGSFGHGREMMSVEVACRAVDFLIEHSGKRQNAEIDFFGGEPLMNFATVQAAVNHIRRREAETGKRFNLTLTTNATLISDEILDSLWQEKIQLILSLDGRREIHDRMRPFPNGSGSHELVMHNIQKAVQMRNGQNYYVRGTYTAYNVDFAADVLALADVGLNRLSMEPVVAKNAPYEIKEEHLPDLFHQYEFLATEYIRRQESGQGFDFFHFNVDLQHGPCLVKRLSGCGAGHEYFAVSPTGDLFPCHQFVGQDEFRLGTVFSGIEKPDLSRQFRQTHVLTKPECRECWARFHCSGGCHANAYTFSGSISEPYRLGCELQKKRLECAIYVQIGMQKLRNGR